MRIGSFVSCLLAPLILAASVLAASRNSPPSGAKVVRAGTSTSGEYKTVSAAIAALPNDGSAQTIFIYGGTYQEQVYITRKGRLTILGQTSDTTSYTSNTVTITASVNANTAGSNDASGTLRVHTDDFSLYNVNVVNGYGPGVQAIALSSYGTRSGFYGCSFKGYQDTLYANAGTHVYLKSYIEGATDFIFGRTARSYFGGNTIAIAGTGWITASGREADNSAIYVLNQNKIVLKSGVSSSTNFYLGRPWGNYAKVIFLNTDVQANINTALWSVWNSGDERTDHILFADYNTHGTGRYCH
jgi:pectinesterase